MVQYVISKDYFYSLRTLLSDKSRRATEEDVLNYLNQTAGIKGKIVALKIV